MVKRKLIFKEFSTWRIKQIYINILVGFYLVFDKYIFMYTYTHIKIQ